MDCSAPATGSMRSACWRRPKFDPVWVRLLRGTMRMITGLVAKLNPSRVAITTSTLTLGIRGTDFIVEGE